MIAKYSKLSDVPIDTLRDVVKKSNTLSEVVSILGFSSNSRSLVCKLSNRLKLLEISTTHFVNWNSNKNKPTSEFLVYNSHISNTALKSRLINDKIFPYVCVVCGNDGHHNGSKLVLQLDHIDGDNKNNKLENLRFLCPNCHSQTVTFGGRNKNVPL